MCNCVILHYNLLLCSAIFCWGVTALLKFHQLVAPMTFFPPSTFLVGAILHPVGNLHKICKHAHSKQIQFQHYHISRPLQSPNTNTNTNTRRHDLTISQEKMDFPKKKIYFLLKREKNDFLRETKIDFPRKKKLISQERKN